MKKLYTKKQIQEAIKYWENVLGSFEHVGFRLPSEVDKLISECIGQQSPVSLPYAEFKNIISSKQSLANVRKAVHFPRSIVEEALIKTYPADKFTQHVVRRVYEAVRVDVAFGPTFDDNDHLSYDGNGFSTKLPSDARCIVKCSYIGGASHVADVVSYDIIVSFDMQHKLDNLIASFVDDGMHYGYDYIAHNIDKKSLPDKVVMSMSFEAHSQESRHFEVNGKLYHIAPVSLKPKILKNGLQPKASTQGIMHAPRVYLFNLYDERIFTKFARDAKKQAKLFNKMLGLLGSKHEISIFEVDIGELSNLKLFQDPLFQSADAEVPTAVYTYDAVPPNAITWLKDIQF